MPNLKRVLLAVAAVLTGLVYVWFAAVRAVPGVKRRKAAARAASTPVKPLEQRTDARLLREASRSGS